MYVYMYVCIDDISLLLLDCGEFKVVSHGRKINKSGAPHERIEPAVDMSGLGGLVHATYENLN